MELKVGARLRSAVDEVEAIVIKAPSGDVGLRCGGQPMLDMDQDRPSGVAAEAGFEKGSLLGKRYVDASGELEVLCTKPGPSSLSVGDELLEIKEAKPLPSSD